MKLADVIERYLEYLEFEQRGSPSTLTLRRSHLQRFRTYMETQVGIGDFQEIHLHHLRNYLACLRKESGYQPASLNNLISSLRALYKFAVQREYAAADLARRIRKPKVAKKEVEHFTWEEVEKLFLAVSRGPMYLRDLTMLLLFYYSGLRREELQQIKLSDLSDDLSELRVEKGKGEQSRLLPLHSFLQRILALYLEERRGCAVSSAFLFPGQGDRPLGASRIYRIVRQCGERAGVEKRVSPHTFRHTFATHLHQQGVDINRLAQLLGHSNLEKTALYTHIEEEELLAAVLKLQESRAAWGVTCRKQPG